MVYIRGDGINRLLEGNRAEVGRTARQYKRMGETITEVYECQA
jgi:hypothetical protein